MTTAPVGSLISGTLNPEDLIPAFLVTLRKYDVDTANAIELDFRDLFIYMGEFKRLPPVGTNLHEDMIQCLVDLIDALDFVSPAGYSFGTHPGDGSDYGWWPDEEPCNHTT